MATSYMKLTEITTIAASAAAVYTNGASTTSYAVSILLHNTNTAAESIKLWMVPDSGGSVGTAADANRVWADDLAANESIEINFGKIGLILEDTNDTIQAETDTDNKVTIQINGRKDTA